MRRKIARRSVARTNRYRGQRLRRLSFVVWHGKSAGRDENPQKNCRDLFSGTHSRSYSFVWPARHSHKTVSQTPAFNNAGTDEGMFERSDSAGGATSNLLKDVATKKIARR